MSSYPIKKDQFWKYDKAIVDWISSYDFETAVYGDNPKYVKEVTTRYRPMNKAFSESTATQMQTDRKDLLPRISVVRTGVELSMERSLARQKVRKWKMLENGSHASADVPRAYNITYQIDIEARQSAHALNILWLILYDVDPDITISIDFEGNIGKKYSHINLQGYNDNSDLDLTEDTDISIRKTMDFELEGWLWKDYVSEVKPVKIVDITFIDNHKEPEEILSNLVVT
jgi:hypothetical protein